MATSFTELIGVEEVGENKYVSKSIPLRMGNSLPIAYGGCALGVAVNTACKSVGSSFSLYSVLGHYLGPASTTAKLNCTVEWTRDTRSFATRRVQVSQMQKDGKTRVCLELIADFHIIEDSTLNYSAPPLTKYPLPDDCPDLSQNLENLVSTGKIDAAAANMFRKQFGASQVYFDSKLCDNGVAGQNLNGVVKDLATSQDHLHITEKTSAEWQKAKEPLATAHENMAGLAFLMDGGLSFLPLTHDHMWFDSVEACASLDFALRVFVPTIDLSSWLLRERVTSRGGGGRSYSEGRLWDVNGNMVASMTQQSIMRLKKGVKAKSSL